MATTVRELVIRLVGDTKAAEKALTSAAKKVEAVGAKMEKVGRSLNRRVTAPLLAVGAASVKAFADFDSALTQSIAIMDDAAQTMRDEMAAAAMEVSRTTTVAADEAAEAYFFLASAGLDAEQSIAALPAVAKFAQAGMFDMATATDLATDAQSALGLKSQDAEENLRNLTKVTDVLVSANQQANATVQQFSEALTNQLAGTLRGLNIEMEQGVAVLAALADQGQKGRRAGTRLTMTLTNLTTAAANQADVMLDLGDEQKRFNDVVFDAQGNIRNLADIIADLEGALEGQTAQQKKATLAQLGFADRAQKTLLTLIGTSDGIRQYEENLRNAGGATEEVAEKQLQSFTSQLELLRNNIQNAAIAIGQVLAPVVSKIAAFIGKAVDRFNEADDATKRLAVIMGGLAAAIGPVLTVVGILVQALAGISAPVLAAGAAIAGLAALVITEWDTIRDSVLPIVDDLKASLRTLVTVAKQVTAEIQDEWSQWGSDFITVVAATFAEVVNLFGAFFTTVSGLARAQVATLSGNFVEGVNIMLETAQKLSDSGARSVRNWGAALKGSAGIVEGALTDAADEVEKAEVRITSSMEKVAGVADVFSPAVGDDMVDAWEKYGKSTEDASDISEEAQRIIDALRAKVEGLEDSAGDASDEIESLVVEIDKLDEKQGFTVDPEAKRQVDEAAESTRELADLAAQATANFDDTRRAVGSIDFSEATEGASQLRQWAAQIGQTFREAGSNLIDAVGSAFEAGNLDQFLEGLTSDFSGALQNIFAASGPWGQALAVGLQVAEQFGLDLNNIISGALEGLGLFGRDASFRDSVLVQALSAIGEEFQELEREAAALSAIGEDFDLLGSKLDVLKRKIIELSKEGLDENRAAVEALIDRYVELSRAQDDAATRTAITDLVDELRGAGIQISNELEMLIDAMDPEELARLQEEYDDVQQRIREVQDALRNEMLSDEERNTLENELQELMVQRDRLADALAEIDEAFANLSDEQLAAASDALGTLGDRFAEIAAKEDVLGDEYDATAARIRALENALIDLMANGLDASNPIVAALQAQLDALREQLEETGEAAGEAAAGVGAAGAEYQDWLDSVMGGGGAGGFDQGDDSGEGGGPTPTGEFGTPVELPVDRILADLERAFESIAQQAEVAAALGEDFNAAQARADALREAIRALMQAEGDHSEEIEDLIDQYNEATEAAEEYRNSIGRFQESFEQRMAELQARFQVTGDEAGFLRSAIALLEQTLIDLILAGHEGSDMFKELQERLEDMKDRLADLNDEASDTGGPSGGAGGSGTGGDGPDRVEVQVPSDIVIHGADLNIPIVEEKLDRIHDQLQRVGDRIVAATLFAAGPLLDGSLADRLDRFAEQAEGAQVATLPTIGAGAGSPVNAATQHMNVKVNVYLNDDQLVSDVTEQVLERIATEV